MFIFLCVFLRLWRGADIVMIGGGKWFWREDKKTLTSNDIKGGAGYKAVKRENEEVIGLNGVDTKSLSLLSFGGL